MSTYNKQQQAVILKGIAQQLLQMNVPSFYQAEKLFEEFGIILIDNKIVESINDDRQKLIKYKQLIDDIKETLLNHRGDDSLVSWIDERLDEIIGIL